MSKPYLPSINSSGDLSQLVHGTGPAGALVPQPYPFIGPLRATPLSPRAPDSAWKYNSVASSPHPFDQKLTSIKSVGSGVLNVISLAIPVAVVNESIAETTHLEKWDEETGELMVEARLTVVCFATVPGIIREKLGVEYIAS